MVNAYDIVLISENTQGLKRHLNDFKIFCTDKFLLINIDKSNMMVFNTTQAWVTRSEPEFFLGEEQLAYLVVTFKGPCAQFSRRNAALIALDRECAHLQFQDPQTKLWLYATLVTPLLYGVETWGKSLNKANN